MAIADLFVEVIQRSGEGADSSVLKTVVSSQKPVASRRSSPIWGDGFVAQDVSPGLRRGEELPLAAAGVACPERPKGVELAQRGAHQINPDS